MYYIRKIKESRWVNKVLHDSVSISDLSTEDNEISVWKDDGTAGLKLKLALAFTLTTGKIRDMWCVNIPDNEVAKYKLKFHESPSSTPYLPMRSFHTNIIVPTLYELGDLAEIIHTITNKGKQEYITEQELKECLYDAVSTDSIEMDFSDKRNQSFCKSLNEIESDKGVIDFCNFKHSKKKEKV